MPWVFAGLCVRGSGASPQAAISVHDAHNDSFVRLLFAVSVSFSISSSARLWPPSELIISNIPRREPLSEGLITGWSCRSGITRSVCDEVDGVSAVINRAMLEAEMARRREASRNPWFHALRACSSLKPFSSIAMTILSKVSARVTIDGGGGQPVAWVNVARAKL